MPREPAAIHMVARARARAPDLATLVGEAPGLASPCVVSGAAQICFALVRKCWFAPHAVRRAHPRLARRRRGRREPCRSLAAHTVVTSACRVGHACAPAIVHWPIREKLLRKILGARFAAARLEEELREVHRRELRRAARLCPQRHLLERAAERVVRRGRAAADLDAGKSAPRRVWPERAAHLRLVDNRAIEHDAHKARAKDERKLSPARARDKVSACPVTAVRRQLRELERGRAGARAKPGRASVGGA
mmetsp:Transcript_5222/g.16366  ORF Transcript_5222/g.16366 Transcript_5222/m.16366 type:complete len:249 (-) Transcript_5222:336-1082(-)